MIEAIKHADKLPDPVPAWVTEYLDWIESEGA